ncbi:DNA replication endonuclease-helicase Dna2 [Polyrhizophydium stewartii]|uniref:DNA replication endonuclease-helicase Dna2 n=1 Tax=Polyrhizophydium stewartii TaxID=2732419 RepID=A0ABR4NLG6_9FUNG
MSDRPAVTWLTSPPAKHLSVLGGDSSSPSPTPTHGAAQAARRTNGDDPADDQALPTSGIGAEAAGEPGRSTHELLRMLGVGGGCGVQGSERYAEPPRPPATAQRKRRRPLSIAFENSLSSPGVGFSSLMQECESVFAAGPSEGQRLDAGARPQTERFARLIVLEVGTRLAGGPASEHEKAVRVLDETTGQEKLVLLRGEWLESELAPGAHRLVLFLRLHVDAHKQVPSGDFIHVTAQTQNEAEIIVDSDDGVLIIHPDLLVPVTTISESFACLRRTVLKTRIKSRELNAPLVFGSVLHELFQNALRQRNFTLSFLHEACHSLLSKISDELFVIDLDEQSAFQQLQPMIDGLRQWAYTFLAEPLRDQVDPHVYTSASDLAARSAGSHSKVDSIVDIEEAIWCHTYGIKGHIDISATVRFGGASIPPSLAPVELKTSKTNYGVDSHRAQTMIYSLIMAEAYGVDIEQGLLAYVCRNESHQVPLRWGELRSMIIMRNSFASHSVRRDQRTSKLPEVVRNERICSKCYMLDSCLLYHKIEGGTASEFGPNPAIGDRMARINERHTLFYKQWDEFLSNEEPDAEQNTREFFILTSQERERLGR